VQVGHFDVGAQAYYRKTATSQLYTVVLDSSDQVIGKEEVFHLKYSAVPVSSTESAVNPKNIWRSAPLRNIDACVGKTTDEGTDSIGMAWRLENTLVTTRHAYDDTIDTLFKVKSIDISKCPVRHTKMANYRLTAHDIVFIELSDRQWATIGDIKKVTLKSLGKKLRGSITFHARHNGEDLYSTGRVVEPPSELKARMDNLGIVCHDATTGPSWSGAIGVYVENGTSFGALFHLGTTLMKGKPVNIAATSSAVSAVYKSLFIPHSNASLFRLTESSDDSRQNQGGFDVRDDGYEDPEDFFVDLGRDETAAERTERLELEENMDLIDNTEFTHFSGRRDRRSGDREHARGPYHRFGESADKPNEPSPLPPGLVLPDLTPPPKPERVPFHVDLLSRDYPEHMSEIKEKPEAPRRNDMTNDRFKELLAEFADNRKENMNEFKDQSYEHVLNLTAMAQFRSYHNATAEKITWKTHTDPLASTPAGVEMFRQVGTSPAGFGSTKKKSMSPRPISEDIIECLKGCGVDLTGYNQCPLNHNCILDSLKAQASRVIPGKFDLTEDERKMVDKFIDLYPACDFDTSTQYYRSQTLFDFHAKPTGWSNHYAQGTKKDWAEKMPDELYLICFSRIALRLTKEFEMPNMTPSEMVKLGLKDPSVLFPKDDFYDPGKSAELRWRLICMMSAVDQGVQLLMHSPQNKADIKSFHSNLNMPQAVGMGHHDEGHKHLFNKMRHMFKGYPNLYTADATSFDQNNIRGGHVFDAQRRLERARKDGLPLSFGEANAVGSMLWCEAMACSAHLLSFAGKIVECSKFGATASGMPSTSSLNSPVRAVCLVVAGCEKVFTQSDDTVAAPQPDQERLTRFGVLTKKGSTSYGPLADGVNFTSMCYKESVGDNGHVVDTVEFLNTKKMFAKLAGNGAPTHESIGGYAFALRHSEENTAKLKEIVTALGYGDLYETALRDHFCDCECSDS